MNSTTRRRLRTLHALWRVVIINATGFLGLAAIGFGLYLWVHPGAALVVVGCLLLAGSVAGSLRSPAPADSPDEPGEVAA